MKLISDHLRPILTHLLALFWFSQISEKLYLALANKCSTIFTTFIFSLFGAGQVLYNVFMSFPCEYICGLVLTEQHGNQLKDA